MTVPEKTEEQFAQAWKQWLDRPAKKEPRQAAAEISAVLQERPRASRPLWLPVFAAAALALVVAVSVFWRSPRRAAVPAMVATQTVSPANDDEVVMWLDADTPLYMTFQSPASTGGKQ